MPNSVPDPYYTAAAAASPTAHIDVANDHGTYSRARSASKSTAAGSSTAGASAGGKKSNNFMSFMNFMSSAKRPEISTPYDPVHLTHVGFNASTGEFTGLPREWQQLLQESGISRSDQEKHPQAVMEIVKFYQEGRAEGGSVWDKMGGVKPAASAGSASSYTNPQLSVVQERQQQPEPPSYQRAAPPPPSATKKTSSSLISAPQPYRAAPQPPSLPSTPALDRTTSQRIPKSPSLPSSVSRSNTTASARRSPAPPPASAGASPQQQGQLPVRMPSKQTSSPAVVSPSRPPPPPPPPSSGGTAPHHPKVAQPSAGGTPGATPRRREKKEKDRAKEEDVVRRLQQICTDADPTKLYRNLVRIGQGASGGVYTAYQVGTNLSVAIKQMDLEKQPKKDLIINEILVMRSSRHPNIVNYIDSFLHRNELWVVMEYMEGGSLTDVVTANLMTEGQIAAVSRETCQGLEHLHRHGVIHRDIKSDNVLLSLTGDIKLSA